MISAFSLPWQGLKAATKKQKYDKICEKKVSTPIEVCCFLFLAGTGEIILLVNKICTLALLSLDMISLLPLECCVILFKRKTSGGL